jgi:DNA processing protein
MKSPAESAALVALLRLGRRPWQTYAELVDQAGSALEILKRELAEPAGQGSLLAEDPGPKLAQAATDIDGWSASGITVISILDDDYPRNLHAVHDRPPLIFLRGRLGEEDRRSVALIGSRMASTRGLRDAAAIAEHLARTDHTVVSGLAAGIDAAAHQAAMDAGGRTVAVIGTGLSRCYPPEHEALQRRIADRCAVVSQFWPEAPPGRRTFPLRNATMSGLSLGTVVVEASGTSGARIQIRRSLAHGRPVFLAEPMLAQPWARELTKRPGVHVIDSPSQITAAIGRIYAPGALTG